MTFAAIVDRPRVLPAADLAALFDVLHDDGWRVVGPTVVDGTIAYDESDWLVDWACERLDDVQLGRLVAWTRSALLVANQTM